MLLNIRRVQLLTARVFITTLPDFMAPAFSIKSQIKPRFGAAPGCFSHGIFPIPNPSPGEEQVGLVLQLEVEVGNVVLLGALLLLAVTETAAGPRGGQEEPNPLGNFFWEC